MCASTPLTFPTTRTQKPVTRGVKRWQVQQTATVATEHGLNHARHLVQQELNVDEGWDLVHAYARR